MPEQNESEQKAKAALDKSVEKLGSAPELSDAPEPTTATTAPATTPVSEEDSQTDTAVDDIMKHDGDEVLKVQDAAAENAVVMKSGRWERFKNWNAEWWASPKKRWATIMAIVVVLGALFAVPVTRYNILGVLVKAPVTVQAVDSKTGAPVSGATVELSGVTAETQANGRATFKANTGSGSLKVTKKYYTGYTHGQLVATGKNSFRATLVATGRQVQVKLVSKVTGKPVAGATVSAGGAKAKTDKNGLANLVIPSGADTQAGTISYTGYNDVKVSIVAAGGIAKNTFSVTPSGKLYFLSNLSGKIDVVKTNLDGTDRQTVLAGTGSEDKNSTSLLASRDWKYLALLSRRSGDKASVYLIDTTNGDKLTTIDEGNANFNLVGWSDDRFIYTVYRNNVSSWQPNRQALKSFDPTTGHTLLLDQTQASGTSDYDYQVQSLDTPYLMGSQVVYVKGWSANYNMPVSALDGKNVELDTIGADGSGHKVVKTFTPTNHSYYIDAAARLYEPDGLYLSFENKFYEYDDGKVAETDDIDGNRFYSDVYPTFLLSPSSKSTFWADQRDGKNALFIGDADAKNQKQIAALSEYTTYGWYTDDFLLVSKNSSELYIMGKDGGTPLKITDYYKPAINYQGYGGGYGGL